MTPYYERDGITIYCGDCRAVPVSGVSAIVCDPPYDLTNRVFDFLKCETCGSRGYGGDSGCRKCGGELYRQRTQSKSGGFMGQAWDSTGVAFDPETWRVMFDALIPGGRLLAFGGTRTNHRMVCAIEDAGFVIEDTIAWMYGSGFPKHKSKLKPAYEPIVVAWKPDSRATPLNIDACRIEHNEQITMMKPQAGGNKVYRQAGRRVEMPSLKESGRWPANVVLDEDAAAALDAMSGVSQSPAPYIRNADGFGKAGYGPSVGQIAGTKSLNYGDSGGASRFFYCAKSSRRERGIGNDHPTVKPLALMRWLVRLVTPPGGIVYDPFLGSGTTMLAAQLDGFRGIGADLSEHNCSIAVKRLQQSVLPLDIPA